MNGIAPDESVGSLVGARYRLSTLLGRGGMGVVHAATDLATGRRLALKRIRRTGTARERSHIGMFEREYLTLVQLAHPRVVEAYDYGIASEGPYYTMELLDGGDLQQLAPLPWRKACALMRDVCSVLALLHARRLSYRDLSPHNVRCTAFGVAKLIDFGAMTGFGPTHEVVGTPPYVAPEALECGPVDARTDLYSLGATLYRALTGRDAFPARGLAELPALWRVLPPPPSSYAPDIPARLDRLVMELIRFDPALRPANAGEVMQRLSVVAELAPDEDLFLYRAYLATPRFVGQQAALAKAKASTAQALAGHGASLLVQASQGLGRSRFLEECALSAKLGGMLVLRVQGEAEEGDYGLVRVLFSELLRVAPELTLRAAALYAPVLAHVLPELLEHCPGTLREPLRQWELHLRVQPALRAFLRGIVEHRPLCVAVDDVERVDEPSLALLSALARDSLEVPLLLVCALEPRTAPPSPTTVIALELLERASTAVTLTPLALPEIEALLLSVFGPVAHLHPLARYVEQTTAGNPRDILRLLSHLVSEKVIAYAAGAWSLPERLADTDPPSSMSDALRKRLTTLSSAARSLAYAFAAAPRQRFALEECAILAPGLGTSQLLPVVLQLLRAGVVVRTDVGYGLAQLGFAKVLGEVLPAEEVGDAHRHLARLFERRGDGLRSAQHLLHAGDEEVGLAALLDYARRSLASTVGSATAFFAHLRALPPDWLRTFEHGLKVCAERRGSAAERDLLLLRVGGFISHAVRDCDGFDLLRKHLGELARDAGLDLYAAQPADLDDDTRRRRALELAQRRYLNTPPALRVRDPLATLGPLVSTMLAALGTIAFTHDVRAHEELPRLDPLAPLSPALWIVNETSRGLGARISGRSEAALASYERVLRRLKVPDLAGLNPSEHRATELRVLLSMGTIEACAGLSRCLSRAAQVRTEPEFEAQALMVRHLYLLWQGRIAEADHVKNQLELARAFSNAHHGFDGQHLLGELCALALSDDLTRIKPATETAARYAAVHRSWLPAACYGAAECQRMRGDLPAALDELRACLALMDEQPHQLWVNVACAELRVLLEMGHSDEACRLGELYLERAEREELGYLVNYIRMPLSLALGRSSKLEAALHMAEVALAEFRALGSTGLNLAAAYEMRARLALALADREGFERYAALSDEQCGAANKRLRLARARAESLHQSGAVVRDPLPDAETAPVTTRVERAAKPRA